MDYLRERSLKSATNKSPKLSAKNCNPIARINIYNTFNIIIMRKHLNARKQLEQMIDQPVCNRSCPSSKDNNNKNNTHSHTLLPCHSFTQSNCQCEFQSLCVVLLPAIGSRGSITFAWLNFCPIEGPPLTPCPVHLWGCVCGRGACKAVYRVPCWQQLNRMPTVWNRSKKNKTKRNIASLKRRRQATGKAWVLPQSPRHVVKCISSVKGGRDIGNPDPHWGCTCPCPSPCP